jgi:hypothetical protein
MSPYFVNNPEISCPERGFFKDKPIMSFICPLPLFITTLLLLTSAGFQQFNDTRLIPFHGFYFKKLDITGLTSSYYLSGTGFNLDRT